MCMVVLVGLGSIVRVGKFIDEDCVYVCDFRL